MSSNDSEFISRLLTGESASTAATTDPSGDLTIEKIKAACDQLEQIRSTVEQFLIDQGANPQTHYLVLSICHEAKMNLWPSCVAFSHFVPPDKAAIVRGQKPLPIAMDSFSRKAMPRE